MKIKDFIHSNLFRQIMKFAVVGGTAFIIDWGVMVLLVELFHFNEILASALSFCVSVIYNYILSITWVFDVGDGGSKPREFTVFLILSVIGLGINTLIMYLMDILVGSRWYMLSKVLAGGVVMVYNFITRKLFLEKKKPGERAGEEELERRIAEGKKILAAVPADSPAGRTDVNDWMYYMVQEYETKPEAQCDYEAHRRYCDIQYIVSGREIIKAAPADRLTVKVPYDEEKDILFLEEPDGPGGKTDVTVYELGPGEMAVFLPRDAHKPCVAAGEPGPVKKIVVKIQIPRDGSSPAV